MTRQGYLVDLGLRDYGEVWNLQRAIMELRSKEAIPDVLILAQHEHVFTAGKSVQGDIPNYLNGIPVYKVERGGQWTYHGPGQLVGYPILKLENHDIRLYLHKIEETIIRCLTDFGLKAHRGEGQVGIWAGDKKIASIGAAVRNWVTFHGFALNVNTDLEYFQMINPCGLTGSEITSMRELLGRDLDLNEVRDKLLTALEENFNITLTRQDVNSIVSKELVVPHP